MQKEKVISEIQNQILHLIKSVLEPLIINWPYRSFSSRTIAIIYQSISSDGLLVNMVGGEKTTTQQEDLYYNLLLPESKNVAESIYHFSQSEEVTGIGFRITFDSGRTFDIIAHVDEKIFQPN